MQAVADAWKFFQLSAGEKKKGRYDELPPLFYDSSMIDVFCKWIR